MTLAVFRIFPVIRAIILAGGSAAGFLVYFASKALARIVNLRKKKHGISPEMATRLDILFPGMRFSNIRIVCNAWLPAHIFNRSIEGMTYHNRIYVTHRDVLHNQTGFMLLVHELVHVKQIRESGEFYFACRYGGQFVTNGGYSAAMPLEHEAYDFVEKNRHRMPDIS